MEVSVLGVQPKYFIRPNNTDWRHNVFLENSFSPECMHFDNTINYSSRHSIRACLAMNARHLRGTLGNYFPIFLENKSEYYQVSLFKEDKAAKFDVIYSYGCYPKNSPKPVVWHTGPTYVEVLKSRKIKHELIEDEIACKARCAEKASLIAVSSDIAATDFDIQFPGHKNKIVVLPFVLPGVKAQSADFIQTKHRNTPINILFVGRESRRKGLDLLLQAYERLRLTAKESMTLTIVSDFSDGPISLPKFPDVKWHQSLDNDKVQELMQMAHIFAMPSRQESFGLVYLEAMAAGAVCIGPVREPQISILGNGRFGLPCEVTVEGIFDALSTLISNHELREKMALESVWKFKTSYALEAVLSSYQSAFIRAACQTGNI